MKIVTLNDARTISFALLFCGAIALPLAIILADPSPDSAANKAEKTEGRSRRILERSEIKRDAAQKSPTPTPTPTPVTVTRRSRSKEKAALVKSEPTPTPKAKAPKAPKQLNRLQ
jgi:hypothetical protein